MAQSLDLAVAPIDGLSVVVVPLIGGDALRICADALRKQGVRDIIVVSRPGEHAVDCATLIDAPSGSTVPQRRLLGFQAATAPLVAFLEDTCVPGPNWAATLIAAFEDPMVAAAGGPIEIDKALPPRSRALGVCEYGAFGSNGSHASDALSGANFALRRAVYAQAEGPDDFVDNRMFDALRRTGGATAFRSDARVTYAAAPAAQTRLSARYHHGRIYGGMFSAHRNMVGRGFAALVALGAPLALMSRTIRHSAPVLARSPQTLLWTILMHCAWGCGEVVGKLTGSTGASLETWA